MNRGCYDRKPQEPRPPIQIAGDLVLRSDKLSTEAGRCITKLLDQNRELADALRCAIGQDKSRGSDAENARERCCHAQEADRLRGQLQTYRTFIENNFPRIPHDGEME